MSTHIPYLHEHPRAAELLAGASVLYTDLDGTLVARGGSVLTDADGSPSTVVAEAIVALARAGVSVVPVSGRDRGQLFELARLLGWDSYIAEAGGVIVHGIGPDETVRYNNGAWPDELLAGGKKPFELISECGVLAALSSAFPGMSEPFSEIDMDRETSFILRGCLDRDRAQRVLDAFDPPLDIIDNGVVRTTPTLECTQGPAHVYHIVPRGVSKEQAVRLDCEMRGLECGSALAIGDAASDIQMAGAVGLLALVDNAFESENVLADLERLRPDNVVRLHRARGEGWAEFADAWVAARA